MSGPWAESHRVYPYSIVLDLRELRATVCDDDDSGPLLELADGDSYVELAGGVGGDAEQAAQGADRLATAAQALAVALRWRRGT